MEKSRGGRRPGAERPALPLKQLMRRDLSERRPLRSYRPMFDFPAVVGVRWHPMSTPRQRRWVLSVAGPPTKSGGHGAHSGQGEESDRNV